MDRGREITGCDCWGLVKIWFTNEMGMDLPDFDVSAIDRDLVAHTIDSERHTEHWSAVYPPDNGDVVAMSTNMHHPGMVNHVGVYIGNGQILHTTEKTGSMIVRSNNVIWARRIVGYYRWVS